MPILPGAARAGAESPGAVAGGYTTVTAAVALGLDITSHNNSNVGRPIRIVEPTAKPIREVLA